MSEFAQNTAVPVERSKREIETMLYKRGARNFLTGVFQGRAVVTFELPVQAEGVWRVQFELLLRTAEDFAFRTRNGRKVKATSLQVEQDVAQAEKQSWRALALAIKARLVSVEMGVETMQEAFLAHIVVPGGKRFYTHAVAQLSEAYAGNPLPPLLGSGSAP